MEQTITTLKAESARKLYPSQRTYSVCLGELVKFISGVTGSPLVVEGDGRTITHYLMSEFTGEGPYWTKVKKKVDITTTDVVDWVRKSLTIIFNNHGYVYSTKLQSFLKEYHPYVMGLTGVIPFQPSTFESIVGPWSVLEGRIVEEQLKRINTEGLPNLFNLPCSSTIYFPPLSTSRSNPRRWITTQLDIINKWLLSNRYDRIIEAYNNIHDSMIIYGEDIDGDTVPPSSYYNPWIVFRVVEKVLVNQNREDLIPHAWEVVFRGGDCDDQVYSITSRILTLSVLTGVREHDTIPLPGILNGLLPGPSLYLEKVFSTMRETARENNIDVRQLIKDNHYILLGQLYPLLINWWGDDMWKSIYYQLLYRKVFHTV